MGANIRPKMALWLVLLLPESSILSISSLSPLQPQNLNFNRPSDTLAVLAVELAAIDNRQQALQLFDRSVELALALENNTDKKTALINIETKIASIGEKERAFAVLERAIKVVGKDDYLALSEIAIELAKLGKTERALELCQYAIKLHRRNRQKLVATDDSYYRSKSSVDLAVNIAKAGQIKLALQINRNLSSPLSRAEVFNGIATTLIAAGKIEAAKKFLDRSLQELNKISDENIRYTYLSNGSCGNDKFDLLVTIGRNLSLVAQIDRALQVANQVYGCTSANGESTQDYQLWAFTGILSRSSQVEPVKQTWKSAGKIRNNSEKVKIWEAIAIKLLELGEVDLAANIATEIADRIPSDSSLYPVYGSGKGNALTAIALKLLEFRQIDLAFTIGEKIADKIPSGLTYNGNKEDALMAIAFKLAEMGDIEKSQLLANRIDEPFQTEVKALIAIPTAQRLYQQGKVENANTLLNEKIKLSQINPNNQDISTDYKLSKVGDIRRQIAVELAKIGKLERSLQVYETFKAEFWAENALNTIASPLVERGEIGSAFQVAQKISSSVELVSFLKNIAPKLATKEQVNSSLPIVRKILADNDTADDWKYEAIAIIAPKLIEVGEIKAGIELARTYKKAETLIVAAQQLAKFGKHQEAIQMLESIPENSIAKTEAIANLAVELMQPSKPSLP